MSLREASESIRRAELSSSSSAAADSAAKAPKPPGLGFDVFKTAYNRLSRHAGKSLSGGLAFGALLSIAPLTIAVIAVSSVVLGEGSARVETLQMVRDSLGPSAAPVVAEWIDQARDWSGGATVLGLVLFFFGGARLVGLIDESFEIIFEVPPRDQESTRQAVKRWLTAQAVQWGVTFGAGALMAGSLFFRTIAGNLFGDPADPVLSGALWLLLEAASLAVWTVGLAVIYRVLPPVLLSNGDILRGAVVSAVLLEVALLLLRALASSLELGAAYGAAGAIIATLLTLYIAAQLFLFGAEVTAELGERRDGPARKRLTPKRAACTSNGSAPDNDAPSEASAPQLFAADRPSSSARRLLSTES